MDFSNFMNILKENYPNASLSDDEKEYISSLFEDDISMEELRDVTEAFLQNAGLDDDDCNKFYSIVEKKFNLKAEIISEEPVKVEPATLEKNLSSMSLNSSSPEPKKKLLVSKSPTSPKRAAKGKRKGRTKTKSVEDKEEKEDFEYDSLKNINAFSQVSRYHSETIDSFSKDIDLKDVNILVGDRELLVDTNLRLFQGVHYGLIGQNGIGKS
eukprot:jgi/Orpsp1_1/1177929/evm.model.c7180000063379.1